MDSTIHINKHLTNAELQNIEKLGSPDNPVRFAIVGDISADGKYSHSTLVATADELIVTDYSTGDVTERIAFSDIDEIFSKRMYGNAFIRVRLKGEDKPKNIFRYTFSISALCDSVILYVNNYKAGDSVEFGGLLGYAPIMEINTYSPAKFIGRGGRIPAPIHSLKN